MRGRAVREASEGLSGLEMDGRSCLGGACGVVEAVSDNVGGLFSSVAVRVFKRLSLGDGLVGGFGPLIESPWLRLRVILEGKFVKAVSPLPCSSNSPS